jgi:two-component system chemotaxis response regulator CheY
MKAWAGAISEAFSSQAELRDIAMDINSTRIMVVEDEKFMNAYIVGGLRRMGISDLHSFDNGLSALRDISELRPDLILTDVHMLPMGGIEFVQRLRSLADEKLSSTPVIFLSADDSPSTVEKITSMDVEGYLVKPPNMKVLEAKIEQALRGYKPVILDSASGPC